MRQTSKPRLILHPLGRQCHASPNNCTQKIIIDCKTVAPKISNVVCHTKKVVNASTRRSHSSTPFDQLTTKTNSKATCDQADAQSKTTRHQFDSGAINVVQITTIDIYSIYIYYHNL
jgi:hypothetical protein